MDFYIVRLYRASARAWRWAVLLSPAFWGEINGDPVHTPLEDALIHFPQPVYFEVHPVRQPASSNGVKKTHLIAVDYALWKEKIVVFQAREGMKMKDRTFDDLTNEEFSEVLDNILSENFGDLSEEQFFTALSAIDEEPREDILFTGELRDGQLVLDKKSPVPVEGNAIYWSNKRLIIRLREQ